jgi:hypothetical protein
LGKEIKTNNKDSWKLYISNDLIFDFKSEQELKNFLANEIIYEAKLTAIKELMIYPCKYKVNGQYDYEINKGQLFVYNDWYDKTISICKTYEEWWSKIDSKLKELLKS